MKSERKQEIFPASFRSEYELVFVHLRPELGDDWVGPSVRKKRVRNVGRGKRRAGSVVLAAQRLGRLGWFGRAAFFLSFFLFIFFSFSVLQNISKRIQNISEIFE